LEDIIIFHSFLVTNEVIYEEKKRKERDAQFLKWI